MEVLTSVQMSHTQRKSDTCDLVCWDGCGLDACRAFLFLASGEGKQCEGEQSRSEVLDAGQFHKGIL